MACEQCRELLLEGWLMTGKMRPDMNNPMKSTKHGVRAFTLQSESGVALPFTLLLLALVSLIVGTVGSSAIAANGLAERAKLQTEATAHANAVLDATRTAIITGQISPTTLYTLGADDDILDQTPLVGTTLRAVLQAQQIDVTDQDHVYVDSSDWRSGTDVAASFTIPVRAESAVTGTAVTLGTGNRTVTKSVSADLTVDTMTTTTVGCGDDCEDLYKDQNTFISRGDATLDSTSFQTVGKDTTTVDETNKDVNVYVDGELKGCTGTDVQGTLTVNGNATLGTKDKRVSADKAKCNVSKTITVKGDLTVRSPTTLTTTYGADVNVGGNLYLDGNFDIEGNVKVDGNIISIADDSTAVTYNGSVYAGGFIKMAGNFKVEKDIVAKGDVQVTWSPEGCGDGANQDPCPDYNVKQNVVSLEGSVTATRFLVAAGGNIYAKINVGLRRVTVNKGSVIAETGYVSLQNLKDQYEVDNTRSSGYWMEDTVTGNVYAGNGLYFGKPSQGYNQRANPRVIGEVYVLSGEVQYADPNAVMESFTVPGDGGATFTGQTRLSPLRSSSDTITLVTNGIHAYGNTTALPYTYSTGWNDSSHSGEVTDDSNGLSSTYSCSAAQTAIGQSGWLWNVKTVYLNSCGSAPTIPSAAIINSLKLPDGWDTAVTITTPPVQPVLSKQFFIEKSTLASWSKLYYQDSNRKENPDTYTYAARDSEKMGTCSDISKELLDPVITSTKRMLIADCDAPLTIDASTIEALTTAYAGKIGQATDFAIISDRGFKLMAGGTLKVNADGSYTSVSAPNVNLYLIVPSDYNAPGSSDFASRTNYCVATSTASDGTVTSQVKYNRDADTSAADGPTGSIRFGSQSSFNFDTRVNVYAFTPCTVDLDDNVNFRGAIVAGRTYINSELADGTRRQIYYVPSMDMPAVVSDHVVTDGTGVDLGDGSVSAATSVKISNRRTED